MVELGFKPKQSDFRAVLLNPTAPPPEKGKPGELWDPFDCRNVIPPPQFYCRAPDWHMTNNVKLGRPSSEATLWKVCCVATVVVRALWWLKGRGGGAGRGIGEAAAAGVAVLQPPLRRVGPTLVLAGSCLLSLCSRFQVTRCFVVIVLILTTLAINIKQLLPHTGESPWYDLLSLHSWLWLISSPRDPQRHLYGFQKS